MTRYYQRDSFRLDNQTKKQRAEKILLLVVVAVSLATNITNFVFKLKVKDKLLFGSNVEKIASTFISAETLSTLRLITGYVNFIAESAAPLLITTVLAVYFFALLIRSTFVPIHTVAKVLLVYIAIKSVPSSTFLAKIDIPTVSEEIGISIDSFMWFFACVPFVIFLPMLPYIFTRSLKDIIEEVLDLLRSFLELLLNFVFPSKVYRLLSMISSVLGACSFILIIFSLAVPWNDINFKPNKDLREVATGINTFLSSVEGFYNTFEEVTNKVCGQSRDDMARDLSASQKEIDKKDDYGGDAQSINEVKSNFTKVKEQLKELTSSTSPSSTCRNIDLIDRISCTVYRAAYVAAIALMLVPFAGVAGKIALQAARVTRTVLLLLKRFIDMKGKIDAVIKLLKFFRDKFLSGVIHTWTVKFQSEKYIMVFLLPCMGLGLFCISLGFWHRSKFSDARIRGIVSIISTVFLFINGALCVFAWTSKWVTEKTMEGLPLVEVEVKELIGWKMIKLAYVLSTISAIILWLFSSADIVVALLKSIGQSIIKLFKGKICRKKTTNMDNQREGTVQREDTAQREGTVQRQGTVKKAISYTKKERMKAKRLRELEEEGGDDIYAVMKEDRKKKKENLTLVQTNILLTRVWAMPLFPAIMCGVLLVYVSFAGKPAFVGDISLKEGTVESVTTIQNQIQNTLLDIGILKNRDKCDPISFLVEKVFSAVTSKLTSVFSDQFDKVSKAIKAAFSNIPQLKLDNLNILFVLLPLLASFMFFVGFVVTLLPIPKRKKIVVLVTIQRYILMFTSSAITFYMTTAESLFALVSGVPLVNINIKNGTLVQLGQLVSFLLLLAFFELKISQLVPISR